MKKILIIAAVALGVWLLVKVQPASRPMNQTLSAQNPPEKNTEKPEVRLMLETESRSTLGTDPDEAMVKAGGTLRQAGFNMLNADKVNGYWQLRVKFISTSKKCEMGDLDLIRIDQKRRGIQSLILALDDMNTSKNVFSQALDVQSIVDGSLTITWKAADIARALALQICSDTQEERSCLSARQGDVNQPLLPGQIATNANRAYYFQFIQEGQGLALLDASRPQAKDPRQLAAAFQTGAFEKSARELAEKVSRKHTEIGSMAAQFENKELIINLPHNDPSCQLPHLQF